MGKSLRVDHVNNYKPPKENEKLDEETKLLHREGCAPKIQIPVEHIKREVEQEIVGGVRLPQRLPIKELKTETEADKKAKVKKVKAKFFSNRKIYCYKYF